MILETPERPAVGISREHLVSYVCPVCNKKLFEMKHDAVVRGVVIQCRGCKKLIEVNN